MGAPCRRRRLVPLGSRAGGRQAPAAAAVAVAAAVAAAAAAAVVVVVVAAGAAAAAAVAAAAGVDPLFFPSWLVAAVHLRCCWRCSVAFGGAVVASSRPFVWIPPGAVGPPGAAVLLAAAAPPPGGLRCVAVGSHLGAGDPPAVYHCLFAAAAHAVLLLLLPRAPPAPLSPVDGSTRSSPPSPPCPRVAVLAAVLPVVRREVLGGLEGLVVGTAGV